MHPLPIVLLAALLLNSFGQTPQTAAPKHPRPEEVGEGDIVRVDTTLVGVPVTVLDREGRFVPGLKREDFHIYEDGEEQPIAYFAPVESNVTVLLLFDNFVKEYRNTARAFTERMGVGDKVLVAGKHVAIEVSPDGAETLGDAELRSLKEQW